DNIQFPAPTVTAEGGGNRVYCAVTRDAGGVDYKMWTVYIDGNYDSGTPPPNSANGWNNAKGPFGGVVSDANYNRRPILCPVGTDDGWTWLPYMEKNNPYGDVNMYSVFSNNGFNTVSMTIVTADNNAKGHQMADTLQIGTSNNLYQVFHYSQGSFNDVNYDIALIIYRHDWENEPDVNGPEVRSVNANPNPIIDLATQTSVTITASVFDLELSGIDRVEYVQTKADVVDPLAVVWTGATVMSLSGNTASEIATASVSTAEWKDGEVYRYWVRARDVENNWGNDVASYVDVRVGEPAEWFLQSQASGLGAYLNLTDESLDGGYTTSTEIDSTGEFHLGELAWMSHEFASDQDIEGTWLFKAYGYLTNNLGSGYLYAKVYRYNSGSPVHLFTTDYDNQDVQSIRDMELFVWSHDAPSIVVPEGDRIYVEYWLHATAGAPNTLVQTHYDFDGVTTATAGYDAYRQVQGTGVTARPPSDGGGGWTEATNADYEAIWADDGTRWAIARGTPTTPRTISLYEIQIAENRNDVTGLNVLWNGNHGAAATLDIEYYNRVTGAYTTQGTANVGTTDTDAYGALTGDCTDYITAGGLFAFSARTQLRVAQNVDYVRLTVSTGYEGPAFVLGYDGISMPSGVNPPYKIETVTGDPIIPGTPPVADAGPDQNGYVDYLCQFDGSGTTEADGDTVTYQWDFVYDGNPVTIFGINPTFLFEIPGNYEVTLTASDKDGFDTDTMWVNVQYRSSMFVLTAGWNLVSFNVDATGQSIEDAFASNWVNINTIMTYDNDFKTWKIYDKTAPDWLQSLSEVDHSMGLWIHANGVGVVTVNGKDVSSTTISLYPGWDLVGYPSTTASPADTVLAGTSYDGLQQYNDAAPYLIVDMTGGTNMQPGAAYWVHVPAYVTYDVDY
ncbi:MAG TPA: PKD domain-containing protein, partial [Euryarchaeota archaeon]|nr:PKD domain-containing protein [Euryarchaeota archaeon]